MKKMMNPYYSLNDYFRQTYGQKCYKIAIDAGLNCPNRDGHISTGGCSFCSALGSGDFAVSRVTGSVSKQISAGLSLFKDKKVGSKFVAYYQAFTNTYGPISLLETIYREALEHPQIIGISIATRPDCLGKEVLSLLESLKDAYPDKFIWIELGLQTCHETSAEHLGIGYTRDVFEKAMQDLETLHIPVIVHVILGLPGEGLPEILQTIDYVNYFQPFGVKLQLLHILKGSRMAKQYGIDAPTKECLDYVPIPDQTHGTLPLPPLHIYTMEEYLEVLISCIEHLNPSICLHRITGDGPKDILLTPLWSGHKKKVLGTLHHLLATRQTYQGRLFHDSRSTHPL
ncbi:MAG: TIGR01212 family radical SAM protein [Lachnospiraceae bacterium]|nr:TIGR01212 family radical SAM protein [Lachnospiraceae bacterium]